MTSTVSVARHQPAREARLLGCGQRLMHAVRLMHAASSAANAGCTCSFECSKCRLHVGHAPWVTAPKAPPFPAPFDPLPPWRRRLGVAFLRAFLCSPPQSPPGGAGTFLSGYVPSSPATPPAAPTPSPSGARTFTPSLSGYVQAREGLGWRAPSLCARGDGIEGGRASCDLNMSTH